MIYVTVLFVIVAVGMQVSSIRKSEHIHKKTSGIIRTRQDLLSVKEVINLNMKLAVFYIAMFVLFAVTLGSRALVEERRKGTLERLLTTRLTVGQLYMGKFLASTARGFVQTFILLALAYMVFQLFTPLSFLMMLLIALIFSAAASTLGLIIASVARTEDQAVWTSVFFTMATVMLGGTFFEITKDSAIYIFSQASINTYVNSAFKTMIIRGGTLTDVSFELTVLIAVVIAGLIFSRILFRVMPGGR